jgi:acyl carrier protein phosphodiesterase
MNFLTHLYFAPKSIENTTGLIIGNTAKPNNLEKYNLEILKGIATDSQLRLFAENHPAYQKSIERVNPKYNKYASFIVNIFHDHLLAKNWSNYSKVSLDDFSQEIYHIILENMSLFPYKIRKFAPEMISKKWITGIASIEGTHQYIKLISKTERFNTNIDQSLFELMENYQGYNQDFEEYFKDLKNYMQLESRKVNNDEKEFYLLSA